MIKQKLTEIEKQVKKHVLKEINYAYQKSVSYSQFSTYKKCPHQWFLTNVENHSPFTSTIHTVFGTAIHETLQHYIKIMYEESGTNADKLDLEEIFKEKLIASYTAEVEKNNNTHFSTSLELREFYDDGVLILDYIKKNRNKIFTIRKVKLLGIEIPIIENVGKNLFIKGYIDFALYDEDLDKIYIYDIKTSTRGWYDKDKKDETKVAQILLYKEFFSKQYGLDIDKIVVEFLIVKRKISTSTEYTIPRLQSFRPASGKIKMKKAINSFEDFLKDCFDNEGKPIIKEHLKNVDPKICKWCPYDKKEDLCSKKNIP